MGRISLLLEREDGFNIVRRILLWIVIIDLAFGLIFLIGLVPNLDNYDPRFAILAAANTLALVLAFFINLQMATKSRKDLDTYAGVMGSISQGVLVTDKNKRILKCNAAFTMITGFDQSEIIGKSCEFLQGAGTSSKTVDEIRSTLEEGKEFNGEILNYKKGGGSFGMI